MTFNSYYFEKIWMFVVTALGAVAFEGYGYPFIGCFVAADLAYFVLAFLSSKGYLPSYTADLYNVSVKSVVIMGAAAALGCWAGSMLAFPYAMAIGGGLGAVIADSYLIKNW